MTEVYGAQPERTELAAVRTGLAVVALDVLVLRHQFHHVSLQLQVMGVMVLLMLATIGVLAGLRSTRPAIMAWHAVLSAQLLLCAMCCIWVVIR